jgi:hypothetical protein
MQFRLEVMWDSSHVSFDADLSADPSPVTVFAKTTELQGFSPIQHSFYCSCILLLTWTQALVVRKVSAPKAQLGSPNSVICSSKPWKRSEPLNRGAPLRARH